MPLTGATLLIGSAAICGLPPFTGFVGEWLVYYGLFRGICELHPWGNAVAMGARRCGRGAAAAVAQRPTAPVQRVAGAGGLRARRLPAAFGEHQPRAGTAVRETYCTKLLDRHLVHQGAEQVALLVAGVAGDALAHHHRHDGGGAKVRLAVLGADLVEIGLAALDL